MCIPCFEALHTTGANYIVEDIDLYIEAEETGYDLRLRIEICDAMIKPRHCAYLQRS